MGRDRTKKHSEFCYPGITRWMKEEAQNYQLRTNDLNTLNRIWTNIRRESKLRLFRTNVEIIVVVRVSNTFYKIQNVFGKVEKIFHNKYQRRMCTIFRPNKIASKDMCRITNENKIEATVTKSRSKWVGYAITKIKTSIIRQSFDYY